MRIFEILGLLLLALAVVLVARSYEGSTKATNVAQRETVSMRDPTASLETSPSTSSSDNTSPAVNPIKASLQSEEPVIYNPSKAYRGFTIYPQSGTAQVRLVNMTGDLLHTWDLDASRARLLPNCRLLVVHGTKWGQEIPKWERLSFYLREYNWDGSVAWEYKDPERIHHDVQKLPSGNYLFIRKIMMTEEEKDRLVHHPVKRQADFRSDMLVEVTPEGEEVWSWKAHEHLDPNSCGKMPCLINDRVRAGNKDFDWSHLNTVQVLPENRWFDGGDSRFKPGNILIMPRNWWTVFLIDKSSGDIVWEYHGDYKGGINFGHEPQMIEKGLPGAGNILVLDNGRDRQASVILEVEPPTKKIVWKYEKEGEFFTHAAGSIERLPNGNTFIAEDISGRSFEVTQDGEKVWEYWGNKVRTARPSRYSPNYCENLKELPVDTTH